MFFTGAALGASVALLYAPQTGDRTRRHLKRRAREAQDYLEDVGEDIREKSRDLREAADEAVRTLERKVKTVAS
jgi:gas vesicle protein